MHTRPACFVWSGLKTVCIYMQCSNFKCVPKINANNKKQQNDYHTYYTVVHTYIIPKVFEPTLQKEP